MVVHGTAATLMTARWMVVVIGSLIPARRYVTSTSVPGIPSSSDETESVARLVVTTVSTCTS